MEEKDNRPDKKLLGYRIGEIFGAVIACCLMSILISITIGFIIKMYQWIL